MTTVALSAPLPSAPLRPAPTGALAGVDLLVRCAVPEPTVVARAVRACTHAELSLVSVRPRGGRLWACALRAPGAVGLAAVLGLATRLHEAGVPVVELECRYSTG